MSECKAITLANGGYVGYTSDEQQAIAVCALLKSYGIKARYTVVRHPVPGWPDETPSWAMGEVTADGYWNNDRYSIWAEKAEESAEAREVRRGFNAALRVRGNPVAFCDGVAAGLRVRMRSEPEKLADLTDRLRLKA
jgi:hypothetical protein